MTSNTLVESCNPLTMTFLQDIRRRYRQLYYTAPSIGQYVSGAIMFKETLYQRTDEGVTFVEALGKQGILAGIKVDEVHYAAMMVLLLPFCTWCGVRSHVSEPARARSVL